MINALQMFRDFQTQDREMAGRDEDRALRNNLMRQELMFKQDAARRDDARLRMAMENAQRNYLAQQMGLQSKERMMGDRLRTQERIAQGRMNQPIWDAERGVFVQRPQAGMMPPGAGVITPQGLPLSKNQIKAQEDKDAIQKTFNTYISARDGLMKGLQGTATGPVFGRIPPVASNQQIAEGGVAAMAPVLKQLFRVAGEGVFTDRDQQLLIDMIPKRTDNPAAIQEKMKNIDTIVSSKLGQKIPSFGGGSGGIDVNAIDAELARREGRK